LRQSAEGRGVMSPQLDDRYEQIRTISQMGERLTCEARDKLTDRVVILKTDSLPLIVKEISVLLALPPDVAPSVLDAVWTKEKKLVLVLEQLQGKTLLDAAADISDEALPELVMSISEHLSHLHRTGVVHADLKPANIFVIYQNGCVQDSNHLSTRLLDFGFSLSRITHSEAMEQEKGGTAQYMAPELARGWVVDGRADQYSLGRTLSAAFPGIENHKEWAPIVSRLCERLPARRFPHMIALQKEIAKQTRRSAPAACAPVLGTGLMRGREKPMRELMAAILDESATQVLIRAREGAGITRFSLETLVAIARADGPATRCLDLSNLEPGFDSDLLASFIRTRQASGEVIVCGIPDPSPDICWLGDQLGETMRQELGSAKWRSLLLRPLDESSFEEIVTDSLGQGGELTKQLAHWLRRFSDGNIGFAEAGFQTIISKFGTEAGRHWELDPERFELDDALWPSSPNDLKLIDLSAGVQKALVYLAQLGFSFSASLADKYLSTFCENGILDRVLSCGYLQPSSHGRVEFVTEHLWREAAKQQPKEIERIDFWLNEHYELDVDYPDDVVLACQRAARVGDHKKESTYLSAALEDAVARYRNDYIIRFVSYPEPVPSGWTVEEVLAQTERLQKILEPAWTKERILFVIGNAIDVISGETGGSLLCLAAEMGDSEASIEALIELTNLALFRDDLSLYEEYLQRLEVAAEAGKAVPAGVIDHFKARRQICSGNIKEAKELGERAGHQLSGSGRIQEWANLQMLAIAEFSEKPKVAIEMMHAALAVATDPNPRSQLIYNLTLMYGFQGDIAAATETADLGIRELGEQITQNRLIDLRVQRAWSLVEQDLIEQAMKEGVNLLNLSVVKRSSSLLATIKSMMGFCHLHRSLSRTALVQLADAWEESGKGNFPGLRSSILPYLVDALFELEAWDAVTEHGDSLKIEEESTAETKIISIRVEALQMQAAGDYERAANLLEAHLDAARELTQRVISARYIHQLAKVQMTRAKTNKSDELFDEAIKLFREEIEILDIGGRKFYVASALHGLSLALAGKGIVKEATQTLGRAVKLARRIQSLGLLVRCLQARAHLNLGEETD